MPSNFHHPYMRGAKSAGLTLLRMWGNTDRLTQAHFIYAIAMAFLLHLSAYGIWALMPKNAVMDIPVRVLSIKLGDADDVASNEASLPSSVNNADIEQMISKVVKDIQGEGVHGSEIAVKTFDKAAVPAPKKQPPVKMDKLTAKSKPFDIRMEGVAVAAPVMSVVEKQFVRETEQAELPESGNPLGNSVDKEAEMVSRYEQLISVWIDKFKPEKIMLIGQPDRVTSSVRIRIDRRGNIRYMEMEKSSDFSQLDRAAIDTVRRANPVPAAPAEYPSGDSIEFIVPIVFTK